MCIKSVSNSIIPSAKLVHVAFLFCHLLEQKKSQSLRATSQQSCSVTDIRPMRTNLKSPTKANFRGLFNFIHARLIAFVQIRDCGIYLILIIDYSMIVATLQIILHFVVFIVFLVRFYA